jgi:hypothetical protein
MGGEDDVAEDEEARQRREEGCRREEAIRGLLKRHDDQRLTIGAVEEIAQELGVAISPLQGFHATTQEENNAALHGAPIRNYARNAHAKQYELSKTGQWRERDRLRACQKDAVDSRAKGRPERKTGRAWFRLRDRGLMSINAHDA